MAKKPEKLKKTAQMPLKDRAVEALSEKLSRKHIALALSGGIGATESIKIARELRRHGATVQAFLSPQAKRFVTPLSIEWATENKPVLKAGPRVEYLENFDLVLVSPATLHTLSKAALGISENVVDLVVANQLGLQKPLVFVPAMNEALWNHPILKKHLETLMNWGAEIFPSKNEESKIKIPDAKELVSWILKKKVN